MNTEQIIQTITNWSPAAQIAILIVMVLAVLQLLTVAYKALARWQITRHTRGLHTLNQAMSLASQSFALQAALGKPLDLLLDHLHVMVGVIHLLDPDQHQLELVCARGVDGSSENCLSKLPDANAVMGQAIQTGAPVRLAGPADKDYLRALAKGKRRVCVMSVPLSSGNRNIGALTVATSKYRAFTDDEINLMTGLGRYLGVVVENMRMVDAMRAQMAQLDVALAQLRAAEKAHNELLANVSRDLRSPLSHIESYVHVLLDGELNDSVREGLQMVSDRLGQMAGRIEELVAVEQPALPVETQSAHVPVPSVATDATDLHEPIPVISSQPQPPPTEHHEAWRMELPAEPIARRKNWLAERLARLDRLQRIALGMGLTLLILFAVLLVALSLWQHMTW
jgi:signal transduction histidine kinase